MAIKRTGAAPLPPSTDAAGAADATKRSDSVGTKGSPAAGPTFAERVSAAQPSAAAQSADPVRASAQDVAGAIKRNELEPNEAVDAIIERVVRAQGGEHATPARIRQAQTVLGDDPMFVQQVARLLKEEGVDFSEA